jgi:hypothetical protein
MNRIHALGNTENSCISWGKQTWSKNTSAIVFAAVLIICSVTVGCSSSNNSDKAKPVTSGTQIPVTQVPVTSAAAPVMQAETKPVPKKVVHRKPATVNYTDKDSGLTFEYPRRYAIETGNAATELLMSSPIPMNFVQPGGVALAAVELPETGFANTDFSSAFFNVSLNKSLSPDQCNQFAVPQPKVVETTKTGETKTAETKTVETKTEAANPAATIDAAKAASESQSLTAQAEPRGSKLLLGDMELRATEAVSGEGTRQSDSKYFHVFQNGACYEFALNVTTVASEDGVIKHVDRDKVFDRLEKILATVKINPVAAPEVAAEASAPAAPETPAQ